MVAISDGAHEFGIQMPTYESMGVLKMVIEENENESTRIISYGAFLQLT